jgi:hypothetical protein
MGNLSRRSLQKPLHPIAIRPEQIASSEILLYVRPKCDGHSASEYIIRNDADGSTVFTVTGQTSGHCAGREFRDASGLPLFELHKVVSFKRPWRVRLPGADKKDDLIEVSTKRSFGNYDLVLRNAAADESKGESDKMVKLGVHQTSAAFWPTFEVMAAGRKVVDVHESLKRNETIGTFDTDWPRQLPSRPVLDVRVSEGFDLSLVRYPGHCLSRNVSDCLTGAGIARRGDCVRYHLQ